MDYAKEIKKDVKLYKEISLQQKESEHFLDQLNIERQRNFFLNYQFYVSDLYIDHLQSKNYEFNPEIDWECIDHFKFKTYDKITCPICLSVDTEIINPHITLCGHICCLYCIVRHLLYGKPKCPVCQAGCNFSDLKTIEIERKLLPKEHSFVKFTLMQTFHGNFEIYPVFDDYLEDYEILEQKKKFQKFFANNIEDRLKISNKEIENLIKFENSEDFPIGNIEAIATIEKSKKIIHDKQNLLYDKAEAEKYMKNQPNKKDSQKKQSKVTFFYQETSGSHLYLHPINFEYIMYEYDGWPPVEIEVEL